MAKYGKKTMVIINIICLVVSLIQIVHFFIGRVEGAPIDRSEVLRLAISVVVFALFLLGLIRSSND